MDNRPEPQKKILTLLRLNRNGLTITDIANKLKLNRNSTAKYLEMLLISGDVALNAYGPAKVYTISHKMPVSAMLKFSADIIIMIDQEMRILDVNENALKVLELSRNDLIGNRVDDLNSPIISRLSIPDVFQEIQVTGEIQREFVFTKQNEDYHYRVRLIPTVFDNRQEGMTVIGEDITEQIRFEERLMISEARFRAIVEDQTDFICRWRPDGTITFINESLSRYLGISCKVIYGQSIFSYIFSEDHSLARERISEINKNKLGLSTEVRILDKTGQYRWHQWNTRGIYDNNSTLIECQSVGRDITEIKESQEALRQSELLYRTILDNIQDLYYRSDKDGNLIMASPSGAKMLGYDSIQELIGKNIAETFYYSPQERKQFLDILYRDKKVADHEITLKKRDGSTIIISTNSQLLYDMAGNIIGFEGFCRDISLRKQIEQTHLESEERFRTLLERVPSVAVQGYLPDYTVVYWNKANTRMYGYTAEEAIGRDIRDLVVPAPARDEVTKAIARMAETGIPEPSAELELLHKDGSLVPVFSSHAVVKIPGRSSVQFCFDIDLSDRKKAENAIRESEERYRNVVEDQTELICRFTPDGIITFVNDAYCRYFGLNKKTCIGTPHIVLLPDEDAGLMKKYLASLTTENPSGSIEHRIVLPDGKIRWHFWMDRAFFNADRKVTEYQSVGFDTTEKHEQIQKIRESEERFRMITEFSPFPISFIDISGNYRFMNRKFEQLFGYTITDIPTGKDWFLKAFPDITMRTNVIQTWKQDRNEECDVAKPRLFPVTCKDGSVRQIHFCPITLTSGEQFVVYEDLTDKAESDRLRSVLASIVNSSNDAIIGKKLDGTIMSWNKAAERYYGYLVEEVIGKPIDIIIPPELRDQVPLFLRRVATGETIERFDTVRIRKDGSRIEVSVTLSPIKDEEGQIIGISTIAQNIAERKKSEVSRIFKQLHRR